MSIISALEKDLNQFDGKCISVTGGTGSFGKAMLRQLLPSNVSEIRVISRDEEKHDALRKKITDERIKFIIGDVRDFKSMERSLQGSDLIFHAAALKQVPTGEFFPLEVVNTNVLGSHNVLEAAIAARVPRVVCLSTDKAVNPINAMGMSKALMEKIAISYARDFRAKDTVISVTRYGNVMCSRGSVIPRFVEQILKGDEITITDPEMTRFLMSLDEAIELVLFSFFNANPGDLIVKKAPASDIATLVQGVAQTLNVQNPKIRFIGPRHGEKKHESLLGVEEVSNAEDLGGFFRVPVDSRSLRYEPYFHEGSQSTLHKEAYTSENTQQLSADQVASMLNELYEYREILKGI